MEPHWGYGVLGGLLLLVGMGDVLHTTLGQGGGFLSTRLTSFGWRTAARLDGRGANHHLLAGSGVLVVVSIVGLWMLAQWVGWWLIFCSAPNAVVVDTTAWPAPVTDRIAFTGWVMVTLGTPTGLGPGGLFWEILVPIAAASGFFVLTLAIAYVLPLVSAATETRQLALNISILGGNVSNILCRAWDGQSVRALDTQLQSLIAPVTLLAERHVTYPALHYLHSIDRGSAIAPCLATLDETLTVLEHACTPEVRGDHLTREGLRRAITEELSTLRAVYFDPADEPPPPPDLDALREKGIVEITDQELEEVLGELAERRCLLRAFVEKDGWSWDDVCQSDPLPDEAEPEPAQTGTSTRVPLAPK